MRPEVVVVVVFVHLAKSEAERREITGPWEDLRIADGSGGGEYEEDDDGGGSVGLSSLSSLSSLKEEEQHSVKLRGRVRCSMSARACAEHQREGRREGERKEIERAGQDLVIHVTFADWLHLNSHITRTWPGLLSCRCDVITIFSRHTYR